MEVDSLNKTAWLIVALLFISGCWTLGCLMISYRQQNPALTIMLMAFVAMSNVSLLSALLTALLGISGAFGRETMRKATVIALIAGTGFLMASIITFSIIASTPTPISD